MTVEVTLSDVVLPSGTPDLDDRGEQAQARPRARASIVTDGAGVEEDAAASSWAAEAVKTALADVAGAWVWRASPPALLSLVREDVGARVPHGHGGLRAFMVAWRRVVAIPTTAVLYVAAWLLQNPLRTAGAVLIAGLLILSTYPIL
jgi:hypothetical protein